MPYPEIFFNSFKPLATKWRVFIIKIGLHRSEVFLTLQDIVPS